MSKILGLDLGTNSIGWAIIEKDENQISLVDKGVRIFSEGVKTKKGIESSRASERTGFRSARRIKFHRKLRKYETLKVLVNNNMCPLSLEEVKNWRKTGFKEYPLNPEFIKWLRTDDNLNINPYFFRDKASKEKVPKLELGRALYHIAQRRGFLSNRLDQTAEGIFEEHAPRIEETIEPLQTIDELKSEILDYFTEKTDIFDKSEKSGFKSELDEGEKKLKSLYNSLNAIIKKNENDFEKAKTELIERLNKPEDLGTVKRKIHEISDEMKKGNFATLGQYFYSLYSKGKIRNQYTAREEHYLNEFEIICKTQNIESINENEKLPEKRYSGLAKDLYKAIFFQRPLKSQKGLIGKCSFEKSKTRCAISHPDFEEYRMWTFLNTIKIKTPNDEQLRFLTADEKQKIIPKFFRKKENFNFEDLAKELIPKGATFEFYKSNNAKTAFYLFNYESSASVAGCPVSASLKNVFGDDWKTKIFTYQTKNKKGETVTRKVDYKDIWHLLSVSTSDLYLEEYAKEKLGLNEKKAKSFSKIKLKKKFARLSLNAINKILPYVKEGLRYSHAVFMANIKKIVDEKIWNNPQQRLFIQAEIANIINNHKYENDKNKIINDLIEECKNEGYFYSKEAESGYRDDLNKKLISFFKSYKIQDVEIQEEIQNQLFNLFIEQLKNYKYIKIKRLDEKVKEFLSGKNQDGEDFCTDKNRLKKLYHPSDIQVFKNKIITDKFGNEKLVLGSPLTSSIKNPMAMRALHQMRKVLNTLIVEGQIDKETIIHIEMARELNDANRRKGIQYFQNENKKNREEYAKKIKEYYKAETGKDIEPTDDDLLRYQLWIEQNCKEIYETGKNISISDIIGSNPAYDIEHTIPRSISQDNSLMNKTLCSQRFNRDIKKNKLPIELDNYKDILPRVEHWKHQADELTNKIKILKNSTASPKEIKDEKIAERHFLTLKRDYLYGKYERFILKEPKVGFKNSQIPDTGIITKYAYSYLKSYFNRIEAVKGGMVAEFRKIWGIQKSYIENGNKYYEEKDRSKHTHHTIDAIIIACMTKDKYDVLAHAWTLEDKKQKQEARKILEEAKPWKTFTEDLKQIENEILVSHHTPDNVKKQSKKIIRIRGKKQYIAEIERDNTGKAIPKKDANGKTIFKLDEKGNKIPRLQQGDTVRGSLHLDTFYGAIERLNDKNEKEIRYVVRKPITKDFSVADVKNIVDNGIKRRIETHGLKNIKTKEGYILLPAEKEGEYGNKKDIKEMLIKKIRLFQNSVKNPLEIKEHATLSKSKKEYKQKVYGQNDENYCMAIYELDGKREFELINNFNLAKSIKFGNDFYPKNKEKEIKGKKVLYPIKKSNNRDFVIKRGQQVILFDKEVENPKDITEIKDFTGRKYIIEGLSIQRLTIANKNYEFGVIQMRYFKEARKSDDIKKDNFKPDGVFKLGENKPTRKMNHNQFNAFLEGVDFKVLPTGKIEKL